jgi:hypothetical protein
LFTGLPFLPPASRGVSVHISFTFSKTMLQCRSKALTLAKSFRLLRQDIRTWVCDRTAVCKIERGPEVNSCSSRSETSYSLQTCQNNRRCKIAQKAQRWWIKKNSFWWDIRELCSGLCKKIPSAPLASIIPGWQMILRSESRTEFWRLP